MDVYDSGRRRFLQGSGSLAALGGLRVTAPAFAAVAQAACSARDEGAAFATLSGAEARELDAIAARILPTTDTPGAREAGVIHFMDQALGDFMAPQLDFLRAGLAEFQAPIAAAFDGAERFSDLDEADQDRHLATRDQSPFFGLVRVMTLMGMFGMQKYGGNRDNVGWKLVGLNPGQHAHQPPFGHYDAEYRGEAGDGE